MCIQRVKQLILLVYEKTHDLDEDVSLRLFALKLVWLFFLTLSICLCVTLVTVGVFQYRKFEVATEIRDVYPDHIAFPVITICNANPMGTPKANQLIRKFYADHYDVNITSDDEFLALINNETIYNDNDFIFYSTYDPEFNQSVRELLAYNSIFVCLIEDLDCNATRDFTSYYDATYGHCTRFNTGQHYPLRYVDSKNDLLRLIVFLGPSTDSNNLYDSLTNGLLISVDDQSNYPIALKKGIGVKPASMAQMEIKKHRVNHKAKPYSKCLVKESIDTVLSREIEKLNMSYSRTNCLILCHQKQKIDQLGCYDTRLPRILDAPPCRNHTMFNQLRSVTFLNSLCADLCPQECDITQFDVSVSYLDFPTYLTYKDILMTYLDQLGKLFKTDNITYDMFAKSFAGVNIYFNEIKVTEMEESAAMSFVELVSNIGGTIGLFISFNLLGFVEFVELVIESIILACKSRRLRRQRSHQEQQQQQQHQQQLEHLEHLDEQRQIQRRTNNENENENQNHNHVRI